MTFTITKIKLAIATTAMALLVPATAFATHSWPDVDDGRFYADAVAWAKANGMTTGCDGGANFCPERNVTRGENITFAKRYDDLVVQPKFTTIDGTTTANSAAIAANAAAVSGHIGRTQTVTMGAADFQPLDDTETYSFPGVPPGGFFGSGTMVAPLHLPDGATILSATMHLYDTTGASAFAWISREELTSGSFDLVTNIVESVGTSGHQSIAATVADTGEQVIVADSYNYIVGATALLTTERVIGVTITYTAPA